MATARQLAPVVLLLHAAAVCGHDRALWQQAFAPVDALWPQYRRVLPPPPPLPQRVSAEEPSSRDLTVGLAVGVDDRDQPDVPSSSPYWPYQPYSEIAPNGGTLRMRVAPNADDGVVSYQWPALQVQPSGGPSWYQVPAPAAAAAAGLEPYQTFRWYRPPPPPPPAEEAAAATQVLGGRPLVYAGPYGDRRVGAFRLRADRGYQLTMDIPPAAPAGSRADGVLVMEMKANLYRPVP